MSALPVWAKLLRRVDRLAWYAYHGHEILRDETLFAWLPPVLRADLTVLSYSDMATYLPGGSTYEAGLFTWEKQLLSRPVVPRRGRVLLAAAGGGRELRALAQAGYEVVAFEPNPLLLAGARETAKSFPSARVIEATYRDLVLGAERQGPLAGLLQQPFDWVLFGWGSFTHVTEPADQQAVLRAARVFAPTGPLLLSFFLKKSVADVPSRSRRMRHALRALFGKLGAPGKPPDGLRYEYGGGFVYHFAEAELAALAHHAGYDVLHFDDTAFPHAVLLPKVSAPI